MSDTIEVDRDELEDIVDSRVEEKLTEQTKQRSRRSFLGSLAGAAGVGALGYGWIQSATATDGSAVGQIGTPQDKVNVYAHSLGDANNPVDELYVQNEFVTDTQQSLTVDDLTVNQSANIDKILGAGAPYAVADDLSDITKRDDTTGSSDITFTHISISGESGVLIGGSVSGSNISSVDITVDGGTTKSFSPSTARDTDNDQEDLLILPPVKFDSSLTVSVTTGSSTTAVTAQSYTV